MMVCGVFRGDMATILLSTLLSAGQAEVTVDSLLDEMVDLGRLTRMPEPYYVTRQFSSYDRAAQSPGDGWFANADAGHYLRVEEKDGRKEYVMMDAEGPGAIVRIWSATPAGTLKVYIDGSAEPALEANMGKLLDGGLPAFPKPLSGVRGMGHNLYFPFPYARRCKVTSSAGGFYYHVNYRTYDKDTPVRSFSRADLDRLSDRIGRVAGQLASPRTAGAPPTGGQTTHFDEKLAPDAEVSLTSLSGPREIRELIVRLSADDRVAACRSVVLCMAFDGKQTVTCPIGDFFATAPGPNPFESLPLGITGSDPPEMYSHWPMPFGRSARITVRNMGSQTVHLTGSVTSQAYDWDERRCLLFHAGWRIQKHLPSGPHSDWTHLDTTGRGRFVGGALHVQNHNRNWWGEGDEKIYIDGEASFTPPTTGDVLIERMPPYVIFRVPGAIEGEKLDVVQASAGTVRRQRNDKPWSNEGQLWWDADQPGDKLTVAFDATEAGRKHVLVRLTRYHDYAQVRLAVNGRAYPEPIDLYVPGVELTDEIDLGEFDLQKGPNRLTVEITGANPQATKNYVFGLDYIRLQVMPEAR